MFSKEEVARRIDHAVLKPVFTKGDVERQARMCLQRGVGCLCVRPSDVSLAARILAGSPCKIRVMTSFPHGASRPEVKALEAALAIGEGACEVDMVMNIGRFLSGDEDHVVADVAAVVEAAHPRQALVKVILETGYLSPDQIALACRLCKKAGADFVKTSTGFGEGGATHEAIAIMLREAGTEMKVKASGGIRSWASAVAFLEQGCARLGAAATEAILDGATAHGSY
jgi:deoxyribose-phosphate aldolase